MNNFLKTKEILVEAKQYIIDKEDSQKFLAPVAYAMSGVSGYTSNTQHFSKLFFKYNKYLNNPTEFTMSEKDFELAFGVLTYVAHVDTSWAKGASRKEWKNLFTKYQKRYSREKKA